LLLSLSLAAFARDLETLPGTKPLAARVICRPKMIEQVDGFFLQMIDDHQPSVQDFGRETIRPRTLMQSLCSLIDSVSPGISVWSINGLSQDHWNSSLL
jgi:hypothetical protein